MSERPKRRLPLIPALLLVAGIAACAAYANLSLLEGLGPKPAIENFIPFEENDNNQRLKSRAGDD